MAQEKKRKKRFLKKIRALLFGTYKPKGDEEKVGYVEDLDGDDTNVLIKEIDGDYAYVQKIRKTPKGHNFSADQFGELMSKEEYKSRKRSSDDGIVQGDSSSYIDEKSKVYKIRRDKISDIDDLKFVSQQSNKKDLSFYRQQKKADRRFDRQLKKQLKKNKPKSSNAKTKAKVIPKKKVQKKKAKTKAKKKGKKGK